MILRYYLDTSIWLDYYENRKDRYRPLGEWALELLNSVVKNNEIILISEFIIREVSLRHDFQKIVLDFSSFTEMVKISGNQVREAQIIRKQRKVPFGDALHAILARDNKGIMVSRDRHFEKLSDIVECRKPEDLI